jgi:uncharacterized protein (TIGR00369 family)
MTTLNDPNICTDGAFAGWHKAGSTSTFNGLVGPYYYLMQDGRAVKVGFEAKEHHMNGGGSVHGGCLLTLADTSLFIFSMHLLKGAGVVTLSLDSQFLSRGRLGDAIYAEGEVVRAGKSVIFIRGTLNNEKGIILTYSGILKRTTPSKDGDAT